MPVISAHRRGNAASTIARFYRRHRRVARRPVVRFNHLRRRRVYGHPLRTYSTGRARYPARIAGSRRGYRTGRRVQRALNRTVENKLLAVQSFEESNPAPIQVGAIAYYWSGVMQSIPTGWDASLHNLAGIVTTQGLGGQNRIGDYIYYKKTHLAIQVDMNMSSSIDPPIEFRFIICKSKQSNVPAGTTDTPQTSLFLTPLGAPMGHSGIGVTGSDLMLQPLNRRDWIVARDEKFILTSAQDTKGGGFNSFYPSRKNLFCDLKYYARTRIHPTANIPEDLDTHYLVYLFASCIGKDRAAVNWEVSLRGTTSFTDM